MSYISLSHGGEGSFVKSLGQLLKLKLMMGFFFFNSHDNSEKLLGQQNGPHFKDEETASER